jgi:hypothetical protein
MRARAWWRLWLVAAGLLSLAARGPGFEPPGRLKASQVLSPDLARGPHHTVSDEVRVDGFYQRFHITSDFGELEAEGRSVLRTRVAEIAALARLSEVSKSEVFVKAAGGAVLNVGKGVVSAVKDPAATVKGVGGGLKRLGTNLGRKTQRAADSVAGDGDDAPGQPGAEQALDAAGGAANSVLGVNGAARRWAQKLGVDPYTTNPVLHQSLVEVGRIDAAGAIASKVALPIPVVVSGTATVGQLVWSADPEALRKTNEARLKELGTSAGVASRFFANHNYTLTSQTRFIAALQAVRARGASGYVDAAATAGHEREALFFVESAEMLAGLHRSQPVAAVLDDSRAMVALCGRRAVALLPLDWVRWTEATQRFGVEAAQRAVKELGATSLEVRLAGTATPAARQGLGAAGWVVEERVTAGLATAP